MKGCRAVGVAQLLVGMSLGLELVPYFAAVALLCIISLLASHRRECLGSAWPSLPAKPPCHHLACRSTPCSHPSGNFGGKRAAKQSGAQCSAKFRCRSSSLRFCVPLGWGCLESLADIARILLKSVSTNFDLGRRYLGRRRPIAGPIFARVLVGVLTTKGEAD